MRRWVVVVGVVSVALILGALVIVGRRDATHVVTSPPATTFSATSTSPSASNATPASTSSTTTTTTTTGLTTTTRATTTTTNPPGDGSAIVVRRGDPARAIVALTFDAGSDLGHANEILDYLASTGIKATFGMTGQFADAHPEVVQRMLRDGHQLLNHSYSHPSFTGVSTGTSPLSRAQRQDQLQRADDAIKAATGTSSAPWFRPPYGDEDASVRHDVADAGYRYEVLWTVDSFGWKGLDPDAVVRRCVDKAENGAIFLMHVGSASTDWQALPSIVDGLRAGGYRFATVAELI